ncbi:CD99 molecule isoform X6 [Esox lucius]|uniref:CD99 molecule isoform X6 n=1 Tax=Esox lucius TaxID=8010 RepID=UPI001476D6E2|nr:CD99 molecule isoform X6 [Esox lucius]
MKSCLWIVFFVTLLAGTKTQDFELSDAFDDDPTPAPKDPVKPKDPSLAPEPKKPAVVPPKEGGADDFDLMDAFGPDPVPGKPAIVPPKDGGTGGGSFGDKDLFDLSEGGDGGYKPDPGQGGGGADNADNADQSQDLERLWGQFLKMVDDNMPEGVLVWISNIKQAVAPLLEKAMELLDMGQ